jgi:hypothetical protein
MEFSIVALDNSLATQGPTAFQGFWSLIMALATGPPQKFILMHMNQFHDFTFPHLKINFNIIPTHNLNVSQSHTK